MENKQKMGRTISSRRANLKSAKRTDYGFTLVFTSIAAFLSVAPYIFPMLSGNSYLILVVVIFVLGIINGYTSSRSTEAALEVPTDDTTPEKTIADTLKEINNTLKKLGRP